MIDAMIVFEFPTELYDSSGHPTGTNRGWLPAGHPALAALPPRAREVARSGDPGEVQRLVEAGFCAVARTRFDELAGLEAAGQDPARVRPATWAHLETCTACRAAYHARRAEILPMT